MDRRGSNTWLVAVLAVGVGFLAALLIFGSDNNNSSATVSSTSTTATAAGTTATSAAPTTTTTATPGTTTSSTTTAQGAAPQDPQRTAASCVALWNQPTNRGDQTFLVNVMSQQPIRVHVGLTSAVPAKCLVTIVGNDGSAYVFPEGGGTTFPYAQPPGSTRASTLPAAQRISNALEQRDGTLQAR
jgi:cytoskeletal protein RodZ